MKAQEHIKEYIKALEHEGITPSTLAPTIYHLLWRMGINITPPFNKSFCSNALFAGALIFLWMFVFMTPILFLTRSSGTIEGLFDVLSRPNYLPVLLIAGVAFGVMVGGWIEYRKKGITVPFGRTHEKDLSSRFRARTRTIFTGRNTWGNQSGLTRLSNRRELARAESIF